MHLTLAQLEPVIAAIHATPHMVVINFAGAGSQALTWLHGVGGSSRTILEATDRYAAASLTEAVGFTPARFTSGRVARALAIRAYLRARQLAGPSAPVAGIGCTAAIATDRTKRGDHRCRLAVCQANSLTTYSLTLAKGLRSRQEEENLVSLLILRAVAQVCGVTGLPEPELAPGEKLAKAHQLPDWAARLMAGEIGWVMVWPNGRMEPGETRPGMALLSGAFNPLHTGHRQLAGVASDILGQEVCFELPLVNADKGEIGLPEARRRLAQFAGVAPVILTRAPLFSQKARLFPHSVFVLGIDTVQRLLEPRFYHNNPAEMYASFEAVRQAGCRFLVAGRMSGGRFITLEDVELPPRYRSLFEQIPPDKFRVDISSTAIRQKQKVA